jgi:hypothetical protein
MKYAKEDNVYKVSTDKGPYEIGRRLVRVGVGLQNLRRLCVAGTDILKEEQGVTFTRYINGDWKPRPGRFELISEEGEKRIDCPGRVHISVGEMETSLISHLESYEDDTEQFFLSLHLSEELFDWLWKEIGERPQAVIGADCHMQLWLAGIEAHMWFEDKFRAIRLEPKGELKVLDALFWIGDPAHEQTTEIADAQDQDEETVPELPIAMPRQHASDPRLLIWLKSIFWMLAIIGIILLVKR